MSAPAMTTEATLAELRARVDALVAFVANSRTPDPRPNMGDRTIAKPLLSMETSVKTFIKDPKPFPHIKKKSLKMPISMHLMKDR